MCQLNQILDIPFHMSIYVFLISVFYVGFEYVFKCIAPNKIFTIYIQMVIGEQTK
jgi:hypothetical protein